MLRTYCTVYSANIKSPPDFGSWNRHQKKIPFAAWVLQAVCFLLHQPSPLHSYNLCVVNPENISNVSHYCDTNSGLRQGSLLKDPSLCREQSSFVPVCFHWQCPLLVRLQYCRAAQGWYFSSTMMVFVTNLLGKPVWILTSMPSDPGVPEGPAGPGWP